MVNKGEGMTDREVLLIAYGALRATDNDCDALSMIEAHLFADKPSEAAVTFSESATSYRAPSESEGTYQSAVSVFLRQNILR